MMLCSLISFTDASEECSASIFRPEEKGMRAEKYGYKEKHARTWVLSKLIVAPVGHSGPVLQPFISLYPYNFPPYSYSSALRMEATQSSDYMASHPKRQ
jgi:hypothetical protein